jgi:hypothetical protein
MQEKETLTTIENPILDTNVGKLPSLAATDV